MNLFRSAVFALSIALMFLFGSSAMATVITNYSHPAFSITDDRTLDLRETGSQIVMETIENVLQQGGLAWLGEGFQIDSSLSWVEEGELDVVIPVLRAANHVVFVQPGLVLWNGWEDEERIDGNFGVVYRTNLANTSVGIDAVGGASLFYDWDFQSVGHSRLGIGADIQSGIFHGAFNYYHPLSSEKSGRRRGFVEEAVGGMDLQFALEKNVIRGGVHLGYWEYDGGADIASDWKTSAGLDMGVRLFPGVFIEGEWEKHQQDLLSDERLSLKLAVRFSLPGFEGASYSNGEISKNLYKAVDREKRILYEERELDGILLSHDGSVAEGETVNVLVQLREASAEDVVINLVAGGSADYGAHRDWTISVYGTYCPGVTGDDCQITIPAGETSAGDDIVITINGNDERGESAETIILSTVIASGDTSLTGRPLILTIPEVPLPTASFSYEAGQVLMAGRGKLNATLNLSEAFDVDVTVNIVAGGTATYGNQDHWDIARRIPAGDEDAHYILCDTTCPITFAAGQTSADIQFTAYFGSAGETVGLEIQIPTAAQDLVRVGSQSRLDFTIEAVPTVSLSASSTEIEEGDMATITLTLSRALGSSATFNLVDSNLVGGGTQATYGTSADDDWKLSVGGVDCNMASQSDPCQVVISAGNTSAEAIVAIIADSTEEATDEVFAVSVTNDSGNTDIVLPGSMSRLDFTIPAD